MGCSINYCLGMKNPVIEKAINVNVSNKNVISESQENEKENLNGISPNDMYSKINTTFKKSTIINNNKYQKKPRKSISQTIDYNNILPGIVTIRRKKPNINVNISTNHISEFGN